MKSKMVAEQTMTSPDPSGIRLYLHCKFCVDEGVATDMSVGVTYGAEPMLRVWCERHNVIIIDFEVDDLPHLTCDVCGND